MPLCYPAFRCLDKQAEQDRMVFLAHAHAACIETHGLEILKVPVNTYPNSVVELLPISDGKFVTASYPEVLKEQPTYTW